MNPQTIERVNTDDEEENSEASLAPSSNKEIVEVLSVLRRVIQHRAYSYHLGLSTVYQIIIEVCYAIIKIVMPEVMLVPTEQKWKEIASKFWTCWNFPNCLGAIDGKHVTIQAPPNSGSQYFCYKKTFSIVLLALVDAHYNFIAVDVGSFGKNSDGGIMAHSQLGKALDQNKLNVPPKEALP
ncbi:hypothetical protein QTP88_026937 [Uroleucon formosanum]